MLTFIRSKLKSISLWLIICAVFAATFSLYSLPAEAVLYAGAISGFFILVFTATDLAVFWRKLSALKNASAEITLTDDNLPAPRTAIEREYDGMVRKLFEENRGIRSENDRAAADMSDYYTAWAHQIKTPITAMQIILQDEENGELSEQLQAISQYTDMVMCYLRVNSESSDFLIKEYDLDGIVKQAVRKFSSQFIRKKLTLDYEPLGAKAVTDEKYLLFVIEQVLSNAVKYTNSGTVSIYLEEPLTLCVRDTGIGVSAEDLPRIFDKGYTGINGRLDKRASGIGLYLCRRICGKLGHNISAQSGGNGTTISIDLSRESIQFE